MPFFIVDTSQPFALPPAERIAGGLWQALQHAHATRRAQHWQPPQHRESRQQRRQTRGHGNADANEFNRDDDSTRTGNASLLSGHCRSEGAGSFANDAEAVLAALLAAHAVCSTKINSVPRTQRDGIDGGEGVTVGIVTPYAAQASLIRSTLAALESTVSNVSVRTQVEVNSVDGFQGHEKDLIVMTLVRARSSTVGFVRDVRRMNVRDSKSDCCNKISYFQDYFVAS